MITKGCIGFSTGTPWKWIFSPLDAQHTTHFPEAKGAGIREYNRANRKAAKD
jgi:hypothetical protein